MDIKLINYITNVPGFPKKGINFKDITTLMSDGKAFKYAIDKLIAFAKEIKIDVVAGPEARGFIFGCPISYALSIGFIPIRKPGKLPREVVSVEYDLEYSTNTLTMHTDSIKPGQRVLLVDDILATGGTVKASIKLIEKLGGIVAGIAFLADIKELKGKEVLSDYPHISLLEL